MLGLRQRFGRLFSGDAILASEAGPKDPYDRDRFYDLVGSRWVWIVPLVAFCVATCVAFPFDLEVSKWFLQDNAPDMLHEIVDAAEPFGDGTCVFVFCILIFLLDQARRRDLLMVIIASQGAGMVTNLIKINIARVRPAEFTFDAPVGETFQGWLTLTNFSSETQSFPSGHTTTAFGLAMALSLLYPRARWLFFSLAVLVGLHRVSVGAHYMSDVFAGAAVGYTVGLICCRIHLWKWRQIGAVPPKAVDPEVDVPRAHFERSKGRTNQPSDDESEQVVRDESSESVAK